MARNHSKCVVSGVTIATIKVLMMFSPASLRCKKLNGDTYQVSVPINIIFIMSAFLMLALRITTVYLYISVMCDPSIPNFSGVTNIASIGLVTWFMSVGLLTTIIAIIRARKQMLRHIHFLHAIQKILSRIELDIPWDLVLRKIKINFICSTFFLVILTALDITLSMENQSSDYVKHIMFYITLYVNDIVIIMVGMQYFVIISIIVMTFKTIYGFLLQCIYQEGRYCKGFSDKAVHPCRPHPEIRTFAGAFLSLCKMVKIINRSESILLLMILVSEISDITNHVYYLASAVQLPDTYLRTKEIALQVLWLVYMTVRLFSRIENGHLLNNELMNIKDILCKILHKLPHNSYDTEELGTLFEQVLLVQPRFAPLEVVTINRTLMLSIVSGAITFLIIIQQFKIKETYWNVY